MEKPSFAKHPYENLDPNNPKDKKVIDALNGIDALAEELRQAKLKEKIAADNRIAVEQKIINRLGVSVEGSTTFKGDDFKITTTGNITRTVDEEKLESIWQTLPQSIRGLFKFKPNIAKKDLDGLRTHNPEGYQQLAPVITEKPAKPSVKFEPIAKKESAAA